MGNYVNQYCPDNSGDCFPSLFQAIEALALQFGVTPQTALALGVGAACDADGRLVADDHRETSIPNLFAAGDMVRGLNQIGVAVGEAALAATAIHNRLPRPLA